MPRILEKKERALGVKLFLKAERCSSGKCASVRRPYKPGPHTKSFRKVSEFGKQLSEKQKVRFSYLLTESQMRKYFEAANRSKEPTNEAFMKKLESRFDNFVFRSGFAGSRRIAKQLISHGHMMLNGRKVTIPSVEVKMGDRVSIRPESADHVVFKDMEDKFKNFEAPTWIKLDKEKKASEMSSHPKDIDMPFDMDLVVNYYLK
ncbi:MAG: 30S ribosomal protein S4 [Candidatus Colwellbacteria bacterium]|nr:30S ribosomal protein S4 [Candidatus Colwellbacteria bacterium]